MPISIEQMDLLFVAALRERVQAEVPRFQGLSQRDGVGLVGREVGQSDLVDFMSQEFQTVSAFEVERIIARRPKHLRDHRCKPDDDQIGERHRVNGDSDASAQSASLFLFWQKDSSPATACSKAAWVYRDPRRRSRRRLACPSAFLAASPPYEEAHADPHGQKHHAAARAVPEKSGEPGSHRASRRACSPRRRP